MEPTRPPADSVAILGCGAAGLSCALWLKHLGFRPVLIDPGAAPGGQLLRLDRVNRWVLGLPGQTGPELAARYAGHVRDEGIEPWLGRRVVAVAATGGGFRLDLDGPAGRENLSVRALVVATGLRPRSREVLDPIPGGGAAHESGRVSYFPLDHLDPALAQPGLRAAVLGGGDNAYCTALDLAGRAAQVHLLLRGQPRAQARFQAEVRALAGRGGLAEHPGATLDAFHITTDGIAVDFHREGRQHHIEVDRIFVRAGLVPNTDFPAALGPLARLDLDAEGYVRVDAQRRASQPGVYAIGDVANPALPAVVAAIADGAMAARTLALDLTAPSPPTSP